MITIDCSEMKDAAGLHDLLAAQLELPGYYGANLDALFDCLMEIRKDTTIRLLGWSELGSWKEGFTETFLDATLENPHLDISFA